MLFDEFYKIVVLEICNIHLFNGKLREGKHIRGETSGNNSHPAAGKMACFANADRSCTKDEDTLCGEIKHQRNHW